MKYKVLITGKNDPVVDGFFTRMSDQFEVLSTSSRYEDMNGHMNYFAPDVFVYCLYKESQERINKVASIKRRLSQSVIPFVTIGSKEDCAQFEADAPGVSDLALYLPLTANVVREEIIKLIQKSKAATGNVNMSTARQAAPAENMNISAVKPSAPAGNANTSVAKPSAPAGNANVSAGKSGALTGSTAMAASDVPRTSKRRELSEGLIREALTSDEAYEEMICALERKLDLLEAGSARRKHVLIVDDDSMMLKLMKEYLHEKYDVATALNGKIALKFLERKQTDLILLDYEMPGENGPAVLEQLRASVDTRDIPVIFLTGVTEGKKIQEALALKPQSYLLKPIQRGKLMEAIGKVIG
ncbi:MAG: response regulator [Lachnospiraceae bacterium]|nr:response regulator [Lachnospiraceae bacterium]